MKDILTALQTVIKESLTYLSDVMVLDSEGLELPQEVAFPFVGLHDDGTVENSLPNRHDLEESRVLVIPYQSIILQEPGAAIMGSASLGASGKGLLDIGADLRTLLNDNYLGIDNLHFAHCDRRDATETVLNAGSFIQQLRLHFIYRRYVT